MRIKQLYYSVAAVVIIMFSQSSELRAQQTAKVTSSGTGYLEYLPKGYNNNLNKWPVVISLHGIGERGTTSTNHETIKSSVWKVANVSLAKYIKGGKEYPFIVISPQLKTNQGTWPPDYVISVINHVKKNLRIDESRIYLTGLSLGGFGTWKTATAYPKVFAAIAPICSGGNDLSKACNIAKEDIPVWAFHGDKDNVVSHTVSTKMVNAINNCTPKPSPLAKVTIYPGKSHNVWDKAYKESDVLNWLLTHKNGTSSGTTPPDEGGNDDDNSGSNKAPIVNAGSDKTLILPDDDMTIVGSASDPDGSIKSFKWTKVSGGSVTMDKETTAKLWVDKMKAGTYVFRLTVTDNKGATKYDEVKVTVKSSSTASNNKNNIKPFVNAGTDKVIYLPDNDITLVGSASDKDGYIESYNWKKVSGGSLTMANSSTAKLWVDNAKAGSYVFRLTVKDNDGATNHDDVKLSVRHSTASLIFKVKSRKIEMIMNDNVSSENASIATTNKPILNMVFNNPGVFVNVTQERRRKVTEETDILQS